MIREIVIFSAFVFSQVSYSCEYTDEYIELKEMYAKTSELAHVSCVAAMEHANFLYQQNQCLEANDGKGINGDCGVVVGNSKKAYSSLEVGTEICSAFTPDSKLYEQSFLNTVEQLKVTMCKET